MSVFPAGSKEFLPPTWQTLMTSEDSNIIDFYPTDFKIDLNGKKYAWQGVALLPFVDEVRLHQELESVYPDLTPKEVARNIRGPDRLFVSGKHSAHDFLEGLYEGERLTEDSATQVDTSTTQGMFGTVWCDEAATLSGQVVRSPLQKYCPDIKDNRVIW